MKELLLTTDFARLLQTYFYNRLIQQRNVSHQTVCSYRDTFRLLLRFCEQQLGKSVSELRLADVDAQLILAFLNDLELHRHNCPRSRNARLAAIRSFLQYAALQEPMALPGIQQVLAIPYKRFDRPMVDYLTKEEMHAILESPAVDTWSGQRDRALLTTMYNTGARVSEIIAIRRIDFEGARSQAVILHGKGRKERTVPLWKSTGKLLQKWSAHIGPDQQLPLFPNRFGKMLSRSGVESRVRIAAKKASTWCSSLTGKTVSPHVIRHTTAMHLLQSGVDLSVIALWLGHENMATTHQYLEADLRMKEKALKKLQPPDTPFVRYKPTSDVLRFLDGL